MRARVHVCVRACECLLCVRKCSQARVKARVPPCVQDCVPVHQRARKCAHLRMCGLARARVRIDACVCVSERMRACVHQQVRTSNKPTQEQVPSAAAKPQQQSKQATHTTTITNYGCFYEHACASPCQTPAGTHGLHKEHWRNESVEARHQCSGLAFQAIQTRCAFA